MANLDKCISCSCDTKYTSEVHIDDRFCYVEGAGQLCNDCWNKIYNKKLLECKHGVDKDNSCSKCIYEDVYYEEYL
jgi:hypothetical protein